MRFWSLLIFAILLTGCEYQPEPVVITATPLPCGIWESDAGTVVCFFTSEGMLAQSIAEQTTIRNFGISVVIRGTAYLINRSSHIDIFALEGSIIVSARGQNRVLSIGQQVRVPLQDAQADFPTTITGILDYPSDLELELLPRQIDAEAFILTPTPRPTEIPTTVPEECPVPDGWFGEYTIERGDTIGSIADQFETSIEDIAVANCLTNVARIAVDDVLRVPSREVEQTLANPIGFRADAFSIEQGDCTTLRWDAFGAQTILLDEEQVRESSSQEVCLEETKIFVLRVIYGGDQEETRELTISVEE